MGFSEDTPPTPPVPGTSSGLVSANGARARAKDDMMVIITWTLYLETRAPDLKREASCPWRQRRRICVKKCCTEAAKARCNRADTLTWDLEL